VSKFAGNKNPFLTRYIRASTAAKQRIIAASFGEVGTGKTTFWLGAPGPIVVQTLDHGLEGVVEKFAADKEIYVAEYDLGQEVGSEFTHEVAVAARDKFVADFEYALGYARTIIWDRESDMFPLFSYAEFGTPDAFGAASGKDWDKMKGGIRRMIAMAKSSDINFGIIQGMKNEWVSKVNPRTGNKTAAPSGARMRAGMDDIDALVHINIEHVRADGQFSLKVGKARGPGGSDVQDKELPDVDFKTFAQLVFPDSDESDWS
jgi:hypothetical protein